MSSQLSIKRRFIDGRNDWRYQTEKAPVNTEGDQFVLGQKVFYDSIRFHNDVICDGKYQGDGSLLTNLNVNDTSKLPLAGGTMTGNIHMTNISTPDVTSDLQSALFQIAHTNGSFHISNLNSTVIESFTGLGCSITTNDITVYDPTDLMTITAASILASTTSNISTTSLDSLGIYLNFDLTTVPKLFEIVPSGFRYTSGVTTYSTSLQKIAQLNEYISSLAIPPNANTLKVNNTLIIDASTPNKNTTITDGRIVINNNVGGVTPALAINQTGVAGGSLVHEMYNQRTATTGEFNRLSFFAKDFNGAKIEYSRIHQNAPAINPARGKLDFDVWTGGVNPTNFLSINGNTQQVDILRNLHMNTYPILGVSNIYTPNSNTYGKNVVQFFTGDASIPSTTPDDQMRLTLINEGVPDTVEPIPGLFPNWGTILCSVDFNSNTYVGTDNGFVYFSTNGNTWGSINDSFNGKVLCMTVFNGELYVGGDFTQNSSFTVSYHRIAKVDSSGNVYQVNWSNYMGSEGFNDEVRTLCASSSGYLYMGGKLTFDNLNTLSCPHIAVMDTLFNLYCLDNSFGTGYGFNNLVNFIAENSAYAPNIFIIGGEFDTMSVSSGSYVAPRNIIWGSDGTYNTSIIPYSFVSMNNAPVCITQNGSSFYIGGYFQGLPYGDYLATFDWSGSAYQIGVNPYGFSAIYPIIAIYQNSGIYWSDVASNFFDAGVMVAQAPFGYWSWIYRAVWGELIFSTNSPSQNPYAAYYIDSSDQINLTLSSGEIYYGANAYTGGIILYNIGSVVDLVYKSNFNRWYVVSQIGAAFI